MRPSFISAIMPSPANAYEKETISNCQKIFGETFGRSPGHSAGGPDMTVQSYYNEIIQIARYRELQEEVTDPLAICLLRAIIEELEADSNSGSFKRNESPADTSAQRGTVSAAKEFPSADH